MIKVMDVVARNLPLVRVQALAKAMLLSQKETDYLIERCAKSKTIEQCTRKITHHDQREIAKTLNNKVKIWLADFGDSFFTAKELEVIKEAFEKYPNVK